LKKEKSKLHKILNRRLQFDIDEAEKQKADKLELDPTDFDNEDKDYFLLQARAPVIKQHMAALKEQEKYLSDHYKRELYYSKENRYPLQWMLNDSQTSNSLEQFPKIIPILNHIYNLNRRKGSKYWMVDDLIDRVTKKSGESSTYNGNNLAVFVTDKEFYDELMEKLNCSMKIIQKYLTAFAAESIIMNLGNVGRNGSLYADGYYTLYVNTRKKNPFLKKADHMGALRDFTLS